MDGPATQSYVWSLLLLAPICLVFMVALDRSGFRSQTRAHEPPLWGGAHVAAVILFWFAASLFMGGLVISVAPALTESEHQFAVLSGVLVIVLALVGSFIQVSGQPLSTLGFTRTDATNYFLLPLFYVLSFVVLQPLCLGWEVVLDAFGTRVEEQDVLLQFREAVEARDAWQVAVFALTATVLAPVTEEIIFRGVFFGGLATRWGFLPAAIGSSLVFGAVHFSISASFPLFLVGMVLCYLYRRTGSIYPAIVFHAIFNGATLAIALYATE